MKTAPISINLIDLDLGWVVGILEGEGAFVVSSDKRRPTTKNVKIQVESTDKFVIDKLYSLLGGRIWESNYPAKYRAFPNAKPSWRWCVSSKQECRVLAELIISHMSPRRQEQLNLILSNSNYVRTSKISMVNSAG